MTKLKMHKAALSLHNIYAFQQCKRTHYCMWDIDCNKQDSQLRFYCCLCLQITVRYHSLYLLYDVRWKCTTVIWIITVRCTMLDYINVWMIVNIHQKRVCTSLLLFSCLFLPCSFTVWICNTVELCLYLWNAYLTYFRELVVLTLYPSEDFKIHRCYSSIHRQIV